jgi:hypothetical protein
MKAIAEFFNRDIKPTTAKNTYIPKAKGIICVQSSANEGEGLTLNQKAQHIFKQLKK